MEQEKNVQELDETKELEPIEAEIETEIDRAKKKRREAIFEMALFFVLGILLGVTIKTEAVKRITMGFDDYQIEKNVQRYDVKQIENNLKAEMQAAQQAAQQQIAQDQGEIKQ